MIFLDDSLLSLDFLVVLHLCDDLLLMTSFSNLTSWLVLDGFLWMVDNLFLDKFLLLHGYFLLDDLLPLPWSNNILFNTSFF